MPLDDGLDAEPGAGCEALDRRQHAEMLARGVRDRARDRVLARILGCACEPQQLVARDALAGDCIGEPHPALRHRARLVEDDGREPARSLEHLGPLDEDAELGSAARAHHEGGRRRQAKRARAGDDQHGDGGGERVLQVAGQREPTEQRRE
jgi:hypothetical protein